MITNADLWVAVWTLIGAVVGAAIFLGGVLWVGFTMKIGSVKESVDKLDKDVREIRVRLDRQSDMRNLWSGEGNTLKAVLEMLANATSKTKSDSSE